MGDTLGDGSPKLDHVDQEAAEEADDKAMSALVTAGPAVFANRFIVTRHLDVVRISFGDQHSNTPSFRTAVALSLADAVSLAEVVGSYLGYDVTKKDTSAADPDVSDVGV
jgi:hypothetical protein